MQTLCLIAHDIAPSRCFERIKQLFEVSGSTTTVLTALGNGKPVSMMQSDIRAIVQSANFVLLGMSSTPEAAEIEIRAGILARDAGIPYGFYSDVSLAVYRARRGAWFDELARTTSLVVGLLSEKGIPVQEIFPLAQCVNTGNPFREDMCFPSLTREEARKRLGVSDKQHVILAPGGKYAAGNMAVWSLIIEALRRQGYRDDVMLVLAPHPGDATLRAIDSATGKPIEIYEELQEDSPLPTVLLKKGDMTTSEVLCGADLVIEFTGSASVEAAYHRIPVITPCFEIWESRFARESGLRLVETVEQGASLPVYGDVVKLSWLITELLSHKSEIATDLYHAQVSAYPPHARGEALQKIMNSLINHLV